ncbi:MAG: hypothetical protein ACXWC0_21355, partial [Burkholderiales bacterium]
MKTHCDKSIAPMPASASVGTFGNAAERELDVTTRTLSSVVDDDLLAEADTEPVRRYSRHCVDPASRHEGHEKTNRPCRPRPRRLA